MSWLFILTAPPWSFAFFLWCRSGFGLYPMVQTTGGEALGYTLIVAGPFWLLAIAGVRRTPGAAWLRAIGVPLAGWPFLVAAAFIAETAVFFFPLPFVLVLVCLVLQCALVIRDVRARAYLPAPGWWSPFGAREARGRPPYGGYW